MSKRKKMRRDRNMRIPRGLKGFVPTTPPGSEMLHALAELRSESEEITRQSLGILMGASGDPQGSGEDRAAEDFLERLFDQLVGTIYPKETE